MNEIKLICDSSANLFSEETQHFVSVPLTITMMDHDYRDDQNLDLDDFLAAMAKNKSACSTACPSIQAWLDALAGSQKAIILTITGGLSGSFASAQQAVRIYREKHPDAEIVVLDSRSAGPELKVICDLIREKLNQGMSLSQLEVQATQLLKRTHLLVSLQSLHNLSLNGRVAPAIAKLAGLFRLRLIGTANKEGKLELLEKVRNDRKMRQDMIKEMVKRHYQRGRVYIDHVANPMGAKTLKAAILEHFPESEVVIGSCHGICSFYAELGGLMVGFSA